MKYNRIALLMFSAFLVQGCTKSNSIAESPSQVIGQFNTAMTSAGAQLQSTSLSGALMNGLSASNHMTDDSEVCDENASPIENGTFMDQNDPEFAARTFYCKLVTNTDSPESIQGAYGTIQDISCALENAGIVFDGEEHSATINVDAECFSAEVLADDEMPETIEITYVASQPAAFNPNFQTGVEMTIDGFGTFALGARVEGSIIEFMGYENQGSDKTGAYVGQFNSETGEIRFESRHDRFNCTGEGDDCSWSKHDRMYVKCSSVSSDGECESVQTVHAITSDIGNSEGFGRISTMSGDFSEGVRTRFYSISTPEAFNSPGGWTENPDAAEQCYTLESPTAGDCDSNQGIELPSGSFKFTLYSGHTSNEEWYQHLGNLDFTTVSLNSDIP